MKNRRTSIAVFVVAVLVGALFGAPVTQPKEHEDVTRPKLPEDVTNTDRPKGVTQVDEVKQEKGHHTESPGKKEDDDKVEEFLTRYGYLRSGVSRNSLRYEDERENAIKRVQKFFKLNITGELDNETIEVMNAPRCGVPDIFIGSNGLNKRYVLHSMWSSRALTYNIDNYPSVSNGFSTLADLEEAIAMAFKHWTDVSGLTISASPNRPDLTLGFYSGDHGDGEDFDGPRGTLAHAFFPEDGRIHMDNDETWSSTNRGFSLEQVTAHEVGHALGLRHTNDPDALMFPTYRYRFNFRLGNDDIRGIQALYGPNRPSTSTSATTSTSITSITTAEAETTTTTKMPFWKWLQIWRQQRQNQNQGK